MCGEEAGKTTVHDAMRRNGYYLETIKIDVYPVESKLSMTSIIGIFKRGMVSKTNMFILETFSTIESSDNILRVDF